MSNMEFEKIPLMNVSRQYAKIKTEIDNAVIGVLQSGNYINGENVKNFEQEFASYIGVKYGIGVGNGTDALVIALRALGISEGDEVITCTLTFYATAEAIVSVGAVPVFVDCTKDTYLIDVDQIEQKITNRTKAILPIQLYGQCANMERICELAQKHGLYVVEDVAQAAGAAYMGKRAGAWGDIACVSFFPTKNLGAAGDGGIILTNHEDLARKCRAYRVHGSGLDGLYLYNELHRQKDDKQIQMDFKGNPPKYYNFVVGYNSRLDELQAALLRVKLRFLDKWNVRRREIAEMYRKGIHLPEITLPYVADHAEHIYYVYVLCLAERDKFQKYLRECGIATGIYFPVPMHLQKVFEALGYKKGDFPNAEYVAEHSLAIPMFPELTQTEIDKVINCINLYEQVV